MRQSIRIRKYLPDAGGERRDVLRSVSQAVIQRT